MPDDREDPSFSRRPTAPSVTAQRDPKATIQPGSDSSRVFDRKPTTLAELDERQAMRMVELSNALRSDAASRDKQFDVKLARHRAELEEKLQTALAARPVTLPPSAPLANPANPGDVLIALPAPRAPSMTGDPAIDAERIKALEASDSADSMKIRSLAQEAADTNKRLALLESAIKGQPKAAEVVAERAAEKAAEQTKAATVEQTTALERLLKNDTFTKFLYTLVALCVSTAVGVLANRASTREVVQAENKETLRDAKPTVVIVKDNAPAPSATAPAKETHP